jgi:hypothetical protein
MRLTTDWRLAGLAVAPAVLIALAGCDSKPKGTTGGPAGGITTAAPVTAGQTPRQAADAFLAALSKGEAGPDRLTARFLGQVPGPATDRPRTTESAQADAREFLAQFRDTRFVLGEGEARYGNAVVFRGRAEAANRREAFTLRLVKEGERYKADWLQRSQRFGTEVKVPADPDLVAAQDTVRNFLDLFLGGDLRQAHALMAPAWRKRLAPPYPSDEKAGLDYNPAFLTGKMRSWNRDFSGYTLPKSDIAPDKASATIMAELQAGGKAHPYTVKAAKDPATGLWAIQDFDPSQS